MSLPSQSGYRTLQLPPSPKIPCIIPLYTLLHMTQSLAPRNNCSFFNRYKNTYIGNYIECNLLMMASSFQHVAFEIHSTCFVYQ